MNLLRKFAVVAFGLSIGLACTHLSAQIPAGFVQTTATVPSLAGGSFGASWTNLSSSSQLGLLGGVSTFQTTVNGTLDANGKFSVLLADPGQVIPQPDTWSFAFTYSCPAGSPNSGFALQLPMAVLAGFGGGTVDISSQVTAALPTNPCDGTVSALYLKLTGGTLTGPLSGTSATFSGVVSAANLKGTTPLGTLYSASSWSNLSSFTPNGTTPSVTGGNLVFTGGSLTVTGSYGSGNVYATFTNMLDLNWSTTLPLWSISANITAGTPSSTSYGLGIGTDSDTAYVNNYPSVCRVDLSTTANRGMVYVEEMIAAMVDAGVSSTALTFNAGDTIQLTCSRNQDTITATAQDLTTSSSVVSASYTNLFNYSSGINPLSPNEGKFAIFNFGGTQTLTSLNVSSQAPVGADLVCIGDSKTVAYYPGTYGTGWCTALQSNWSTVVEAGGGDVLQSGLNVLPELIALNPKAYIINLGRNGGSNAQYDSLVSQLQTAHPSTPVYHLLPLDENTGGVDQTALAAHIIATYPLANQVNANPNTALFTVGNVPSGWLAPDGIHPTITFENNIVQQVRNFLTEVFPNIYVPYSGASSSIFSTLFVGNVNQVQGGGYYFFGDNQPETNTSLSYAGSIAQSNDSANPFALSVLIQGAATAAARTAILQTVQAGLSNTGILSLQPAGGSLLLNNMQTGVSHTSDDSLSRLQFTSNGPTTIEGAHSGLNTPIVFADSLTPFIHFGSFDNNGNFYAHGGYYSNSTISVIPSTALGFQGPSAGYLQFAPAPGSAGCLYQNGGGTYSWTNCLPGVSDVTFTTGTTAVAANSCNPTAGGGGTSVTMSGLTSTMALAISTATDTSSVTGWGAPASTVLYMVVKPGSGAFTYYVCNNSSSSVTPGSSITWNASAR